MESDLCSVLIKIPSPHWSVYSGNLSVGWGESSSPYLVSSRRRRKRHTHRGSSGGEKEEVTLMVSTLTFIQANLQHSIAASRILARMVSGKGIDMALIQELWYCENCIRRLNIPG
jgi:hypothetical protein